MTKIYIINEKRIVAQISKRYLYTHLTGKGQKVLALLEGFWNIDIGTLMQKVLMTLYQIDANEQSVISVRLIKHLQLNLKGYQRHLIDSAIYARRYWNFASL